MMLNLNISCKKGTAKLNTLAISDYTGVKQTDLDSDVTFTVFLQHQSQAVRDRLKQWRALA